MGRSVINNHVTFVGLEKLYGAEARRAAMECLRQNGEMLRDEMIKRAPVGDPKTDKHSGRLKASIRMDVEESGKKVLVGTDVSYSRLTEFDPRQLAKHSAWAYPSLDALKPKMYENMIKAIKRAVTGNENG